MWGVCVYVYIYAWLVLEYYRRTTCLHICYTATAVYVVLTIFELSSTLLRDGSLIASVAGIQPVIVLIEDHVFVYVCTGIRAVGSNPVKQIISLKYNIRSSVL